MINRLQQEQGTTTDEELEDILEAAGSASESWAATGRTGRAEALRQVAAALENAADDLVSIAQEETHLPETRLRGELVRTVFQLRLFAEVILEGEYLGVRIDHADPEWGMGPRPDLRRILEPMGPVLVFSASNFPFAFSVAGGDTASALAAGCPVILKAHSGHVRLSLETGRVVKQALSDFGAAPGVFDVITGTQAGRDAILDRRVKAAGFTGSIPGGRALFDLANGREEPIPFYGELGSVNPVFVTASASEKRAEEILRGFVSSFTLGVGQFCTKPGLLFVPADSRILGDLEVASLPGPATMLNKRVHDGFTRAVASLEAHSAVKRIAQDVQPGGELAARPRLYLIEIDDLFGDFSSLTEECFGPSAIIVKYQNSEQLVRVAEQFPGQLTATVFAEENDAIVPRLVSILAKRAGRVLWNEWPTGVTVSYAQQHGGPYPATTAPASTSVGTAAILRFLRPVAYQGFPQYLLPEELQDDTTLPRLVDGSRLEG